VPVASLATNFVLRKAVYIGKNTYLGLTEEGDMISFCLNDQNQIEYAQQKCANKKFIDIDVDETIKTKTGFMPHIGLLAKNGDVYLTNLLMGEMPTLLYTGTLNNPDNIFRFFYDKGQCAVVYCDAFRFGQSVVYGDANNCYDTFHVWHSNFNLVLACMSLKNSQESMIKEEK
jgi:hypothetical protein